MAVVTATATESVDVYDLDGNIIVTTSTHAAMHYMVQHIEHYLAHRTND
jgi:hypothetical protein